MTRVIVALAPVSVFGIFLYGIPALLTILVSMAAAELAEFLFRKAARMDIRNADLSAVVTGLLLALILPPGTPLWITALGSVFAIVVAKEFFGGLGANVFNPALIGRAFLLMSFPAAITSWDRPRAFFAAAVDAAGSASLTDVITSATPLGIIKAGQSVASVGAGFAASGLAPSAGYGRTLLTLFLGLCSGSIGESSSVLILIGFVYLLVTKTIDWRAPVTMAASV
jgi:electron transport complex protein RnfD